MGPDLRNGEPAHGVGRQEPCDEVLDSVADVPWSGVVRCKDLFVQRSSVLILERQVAADKREEDDSAAPEVARRRHVAEAGDHLGWRIARRAASRLQALALTEDVAEPEVYDLDTPVLVKQQVLRLQVPVHHLHLVHLLHAGHDLVEEAARLGLLYPPARDDVVEELAAAGVFHDEVQLPPGLDDLVKLDDVGVSDKLEDVHLTSDALNIGNLHDSILLQDLHGHAFAREDVAAELHLAEGAFPNGFPQHVVPDGLVVVWATLLRLLWLLLVLLWLLVLLL
mmetsp:Transcript_6914/g.21503  ORF Transcript_6914/g.21503 Transcript_6914/m.21503 type:complete len:281 (-) Transcript_6914:196-1038(-)